MPEKSEGDTYKNYSEAESRICGAKVTGYSHGPGLGTHLINIVLKV